MGRLRFGVIRRLHGSKLASVPVGALEIYLLTTSSSTSQGTLESIMDFLPYYFLGLFLRTDAVRTFIRLDGSLHLGCRV